MATNYLQNDVEKAILVGVVLPGDRRWEVNENLGELKQLAGTSGVEVVDEMLQERQSIHSAHFIGKGKVEELNALIKMHKVKTVIFDQDLTPAQSRNLEKLTEVKIIDRSALILDIFAGHARTREAKTQVELAQLQYFLPRLTRQWTHLSRQHGGIGTKGPGETQLETDRRLIRKRIETLRKELKKIEQQRRTQRKGRVDSFKASLIGYTNVGKSTIMNLLSGSDVLVEDQLFATLDSTVRKVQLDNANEILLSDTVGFIRKLPHHLVASFRSTLEEAVSADLLIHVVDISHPNFQEQIRTVNQVIEDVGAGDKPVLVVFNKIDLLKEKAQMAALKQQYPESVFISAQRQIRTEQLRSALLDFLKMNFIDGEIAIPISHSRLVGKVYDLAMVTAQKYTDTAIHLRFRCRESDHKRIERLLNTIGSGNGGAIG